MVRRAGVAQRRRPPTHVVGRWPRSRPSARSEGRLGSPEHRASYSRSYLPHFDAAYIAQGLTFRLADSVPRSVIQRWREEIDLSEVLETDEARYEELQRRIAHYEDAGFGECHLRCPEIATLVCQALLRFHRQRYRLREWCVMPNHVHVLVNLFKGFPLGVCPVEKMGGQKFHPDAETLTMEATIDHREVRLRVNTTVFSHHDVRKSSYGTGS